MNVRHLGWLILSGSLFLACSGEDATSANACTVQTLDNADLLITCPDGTEAVLVNGQDGQTGHPGTDGEQTGDCVLGINDDQMAELRCEDHTTPIVYDCHEGFPGDLTLDTNPIGAVLFYTLGCTSVQGNVVIRNRPFADDEEEPLLYADVPVALTELTHIGGHLFIEGTDLQDIALPALTSIDGTLRIRNNPYLTTLSSLQNLKTVGGDIIIRENFQLPACEADRLADVLTAPPAEHAMRVGQREYAAGVIEIDPERVIEIDDNGSTDPTLCP